jgi:hypothetical protein
MSPLSGPRTINEHFTLGRIAERVVAFVAVMTIALEILDHTCAARF